MRKEIRPRVSTRHVSARLCKMGEPDPPRETKNTGANGGKVWKMICVEKRAKRRKVLPESRGTDAEQDVAQHDDKSSDRDRARRKELRVATPQCADNDRGWQARVGRAVEVLGVDQKTGCDIVRPQETVKRRSGQSAAMNPEATGEGKKGANVELNWLFARLSPVPKYDRRSSSVTGYGT